MICSRKTGVFRLVPAAFFAAAMAVSPVALAHGGGGGGGGGMSGVHGDFGGNSAGEMSAKGSANTNGPNASDRDFGKSHAEDRHLLHHGRHHGKGKSKEETHESASAEIHEHR